MAERPGGRRKSRRDSLEAGSSVRGTPPGSKDRRTKRSSKPSKERWLLTRKTWRYMADAGRRLIPDGTHNRAEDIPKIEQYFQEVCQKEPKFLLWRKASYPGTLGLRSQRRRRQAKGGSCRTKASSADEADESKTPPPNFVVQSTGTGKFDLAKVKREWLLASSSGGGSTPSSPVVQRRDQQEDLEAKALADMLQKYLNMQSDDPGKVKPIEIPETTPASNQSEGNKSFDYKSLIDKLQRHVDLLVIESKKLELSGEIDSNKPGTIFSKSTVSSRSSPSSFYQGDYVQKSLMETLSRYYNKSENRQHMISDILTDRKFLEKLYFNLRCTRGFKGPRPTGAYTSPPSHWSSLQQTRLSSKDYNDRSTFGGQKDTISVPPLIAVQEPSTEQVLFDNVVQTDPVSREILDAVLAEREKNENSKEASQKGSGRRRSSVDNDDVSPSVSDTIKRYLRMARKKSMDADKADRFKRVNYDRNLRNIKAKGEITKPGDDDGNSKGCQTEDNWAVNYREMGGRENSFAENASDADTASPASRNASSRSSIDAGLGSEEPLTPKHHHHQSFLSHLLHGSNTHKDKPHSAPGSPALTSTSTNSAGGSAMQKSKSSSSVVHHGSRLVAKKIFRSRSKSTSRATNQPSVWTPQGKCTWAGTNGRRVTLQDVSLRTLSDVERRVLCKVAVAKLQALNLGVHIRPPTESLSASSSSTKPKRRAYLLKRKALTTGFFDNKGKDEKDKDTAGGLVFGIPLSQCLENDRIARIASGEISDVGCLTRSSRHGSRTSFTSLIESATTAAAKTEEGGSCDSLSSKGGGALTGSDSGILELSDSGGASPSGEWDSVPSIVRQCIKHLELTGLNTLGIFRVSPSKKRVRQLREDFDCGRETKIGIDQCPHDVATLLKEYFRDLPDPLLCRDLYQAFVHTQKIRNRRLQHEALQHLVQLLPTPNRETLWALLNFLSEVAANSEDRKTDTGEWIQGNKMDTANLATVFAPNILHCVKAGQARSEVSVERAEERIDVINVVRALLEHAPTLFTVPAALLDELYLHMMDTHPAELDLALSRRVEEQCVDEQDPCSDAETFSIEESLITSGVAPPSNTSAEKIWSREQCLHKTAGIGGDIGPRHRRVKRPGSRRKDDTRSNSVDSASSEDPVDPRRKSSPMVITASLTIPMSGTFTLNLDDPDIPFIEETAKQPSAPPRRQRQRSISGCSEGGRHGSDSAVGSSATLSGDQAPSSPPSWASTPPASPDSAVTAVNYIPEQQAMLQRVSFTTSSEVRQVSRSSGPETARTVPVPYTPSITSIGGAVMRSKTADIERMLHISRPEASSGVTQPGKTSTSSESKKYTKRRYTDSRHQTRHIPDADTLSGKGATTSSTTTIATSSSSATSNVPSQRASTQPVWKRRELISSAPKDRGGYY